MDYAAVPAVHRFQGNRAAITARPLRGPGCHAREKHLPAVCFPFHVYDNLHRLIGALVFRLIGEQLHGFRGPGILSE